MRPCLPLHYVPVQYSELLFCNLGVMRELALKIYPRSRCTQGKMHHFHEINFQFWCIKPTKIKGIICKAYLRLPYCKRIYWMDVKTTMTSSDCRWKWVNFKKIKFVDATQKNTSFNTWFFFISHNCTLVVCLHLAWEGMISFILIWSSSSTVPRCLLNLQPAHLLPLKYIYFHVL